LDVAELTGFIFRETVERALKEDLGSGDLTTACTVAPGATGGAAIIAREEGIIAGLPLAGLVFQTMDPALQCNALVSDGDRVGSGQAVMRLTGRLQPILSGERTALNFLQRLSGIATQTAAWAAELAGFPARLADTRKTTPGLRLLEKYAVRVGGGVNHRLALDGGILIKENHIRAAGGIRTAVEAARSRAPFTLRVEVEATCLREVEEALEAGADLIMLDNMDTGTMHRAVELVNGRALLEASGRITPDRLRAVAATGVDYISCGALTHSYRSLDLTLLVDA
jgi:nicotinate-nucleotide pyrophosphorylase (carboxylating)